MASDRLTTGGISTPVNKRGTTTSAQEDRCDPGGELFYGFLPGRFAIAAEWGDYRARATLRRKPLGSKLIICTAATVGILAAGEARGAT
jgi:rRNA maturation protein Nop10